MEKQLSIPSETAEKMPLNKYLSRAGVAGRRTAADFVRAGRVAVNGAIVTEPGFPVPEGASVALDGVSVASGNTPHIYVMLNKPRGYVCTHSDPHADRKAIDLLRDVPCRLVAAGRLDKDSEGLLLFSNDGNFIHELSHPRYNICKTYLVTLDVPMPAGAAEKVTGDGIIDGDERVKALVVEPVRPPRVWRFVLNEGKKREIRRIAAVFGCRVRRLVRVKTGNLELGTLPTGAWRYLSPEEVAKALEPGVNMAK